MTKLTAWFATIKTWPRTAKKWPAVWVSGLKGWMPWITGDSPAPDHRARKVLAGTAGALAVLLVGAFLLIGGTNEPSNVKDGGAHHPSSTASTTSTTSTTAKVPAPAAAARPTATTPTTTVPTTTTAPALSESTAASGKQPKHHAHAHRHLAKEQLVSGLHQNASGTG